jgi:hypothetical protein
MLTTIVIYIYIYIFFMVHTNSLHHGLSHKQHYSQVVFPVNKFIITFSNAHVFTVRKLKSYKTRQNGIYSTHIAHLPHIVVFSLPIIINIRI